MIESSNITELIQAVRDKQDGADDRLLSKIYCELHDLANGQMSREKAGHTLQATALIHEAYLRLFDNSSPNFENRAHFFGAASEAMRRILVEHARKKKSIKHGGKEKFVEITGSLAADGVDPDEIIDVNEALNDFESKHPDKAKLVKLRYFVGMTIPDAASALDISVATANRYWVYAQAWLHDRIHSGE